MFEDDAARYEVTTTWPATGETVVGLVDGGYVDTYLYPGTGVRVQHVKFLRKVLHP